MCFHKQILFKRYREEGCPLKKKVIIIGAGVGGLATAVRLLSRGYDVTIYEKEGNAGGRVNILNRQGFSFDLTASILLLPKEFQEVFQWADRDYRDYVKFKRVDPLYRVHDNGGGTFDLHSDLTDCIDALESLSIDDARGYLNFLADSYQKYQIANRRFLQKSYSHVGDFINTKVLINGLKLRTLSTSYDFISKYIKNKKLRELLCFQAFLIGISPYEGPNIYTILPCVSQLYGLWYIEGGMYSYVKALEKLIHELGGRVILNTPVTEILISHNNAVGVKTESETEKSDIVVCSADFPYAMKELIKDKKAKDRYSGEKLDKMDYSCSTFVLYLGLKKKYPRLTLHNLYMGSHFKKSIEQAFTGYLPQDPILYMYCPSSMDESMAPPDMECLSITVRVPNLSFGKIKWNEDRIKTMRDTILNQLSRIKGLEDIGENIVFEEYLTPLDLSTRFNSYHGTAFGLSPTLIQSNYFRPKIKSPRVDNLYFVGNSVHPGNGISLVLLSSRLAAEEILKNA